jgi:hypothetical protein
LDALPGIQLLQWELLCLAASAPFINKQVFLSPLAKQAWYGWGEEIRAMQTRPHIEKPQIRLQNHLQQMIQSHHANPSGIDLCPGPWHLECTWEYWIGSNIALELLQ